MDNFWYLFWAYAIFWIALFIYVYSLLKKSKELRREVGALKDSLFIIKDSSSKIREEAKQ